MPDRAAFLKGVNLGKRRISNEELRGHFLTLGLHEPAVFRASGNVVFSDPQARSDDDLTELVETGLERLMGYGVPSFIRTGPELLAISAAEPFDQRTSSRLAGKLQVMLLGKRPAKKTRAQALELAGAQDALAFGVRELYWLPAGGMSDSTLELRALERLLGAMTIRTMGTIEQIAAKHFAP
jgi:uncharacterized protein (DUF1697 family)